MELMNQLQLNIPFMEAITQMPKYAKYLKDLFSNKKKLEGIATVSLNEECSAILQSHLLTKRKDLWSFTIPCFIGNNPYRATFPKRSRSGGFSLDAKNPYLIGGTSRVGAGSSPSTS
ncbi:unnamed protein product [Linum trigynum]|uniref:Retrotransposon gag protein n=1 Tax=Linum trigynum TaxID=586398 RepID=A0AAV2E6J3_9ROSI